MGEGCHGERKADEVEDKETQSGGILKGHACSRKKLTHKLKRTRSTHEIRNVSERRRRDRINGKVRALQELIPHCTKKDRASILEDAVEYIKTLKLQSEMMTKPTGVGCLAPYISCSGNPVMQLPSLSSFVPIGPGIGMGIGMACGAGMSYIGSCARGAPLIQLPAVSLSPSAIVGFPFSTMYARTAAESGEMGALSEAHPSRSRGSYAAAGSSISYGLHSGGLALKK